MPAYDYKCKHCGAQVELNFPIKQVQATVKCINCNIENGMEKMLSAPLGFEFKGGGYYQTDFKAKK